MTTTGDEFFAGMAHLMSPAEIDQLRHTGMGKRLGFGARPALVIIDAQNYMVGATGPDDHLEYPSACASGRPAIEVIRRLAEGFRAAGRPVFYTRNVARRDGRDMGIKRLKRGILDIEGWYLEGTKGAEIVPAIAPHPEDIVLVKTKQSGFHGTPLLDLLVAAAIDTLVIAGGSTSNCVRATAIDSASYNFRTIVPRDAVFDRVRISHEVNLMDIDRQLGDVVNSEDVLSYLRSLVPARGEEADHE
jgi:nicotinamidase-related amidase